MLRVGTRGTILSELNVESWEWEATNIQRVKWLAVRGVFWKIALNLKIYMETS